ncbi:hypothetical protein SBBP1_1170001 [Burkholderiales bacterium]|nr:hypothetical protein SBBP1_1170001 [Burkholderiales bacterium]
MSTDAFAPVAPAVRARSAPSAGLVPGARYWQAQSKDRIWVRLLFVPNSKIEVGIWWNRLGRHADVQLVFGLYGDSVELGCLTGNGFDAPGFHRLGFGTFAVNIAVQALKVGFPPSHLVHGVLSNTAEEELPTEERLRLEAGRRAFWRRFGLEVVSRGDPPLDYLRGSVGGLRVVPTGLLAGQFPRCISLLDFVSERPAGL